MTEVRHAGTLAWLRASAVLWAAVTAGLLVIASAFASTAAAADCTKQTVDVGIVKAMGCWTKSTVGADTVYTAPFVDNEDGIDMNGFIVSGGGGARLQINATKRVVRSAAKRALRSGARKIRLVVEIGHAEEPVTGTASVRL